MMNANLMIELKKEYLCQLCNILTPLVNSGLQSIYTDVKKTSTDANVLINFQSKLKIIKDWKQETIETEVARIVDTTHKSTPWFIDLILALFKVNQYILGIDVSEEMIKDITVSKFIHHVYIECAREFHMMPYLFYHQYKPIEIKQNNNHIILKIHNSIENAIRRLLPMGIILEKFLGDKSINSKNIDINEIYNMPLLCEINFNKQISPPSEQTIEQPTTQSIKQTITEIQQGGGEINEVSVSTSEKHRSKHSEKHRSKHSDRHKSSVTQTKGSITNDTNNKILNIINKHDLKLSESNDVVKQFIELSHKSNDSSVLKHIIHESLNPSQQASSGINTNVRNKVLKQLDSDTETVMLYKSGEKYQDVYSNTTEVNKNTKNNKNDAKPRDKFFNNYLNI